MGAGTSVEQARAGALLSVVSVVALGVLPRLALMASAVRGWTTGAPAARPLAGIR